MDNLETCQNKNVDNGPNQLNNVNTFKTNSILKLGIISQPTRNEEQPSAKNNSLNTAQEGVMKVFKLIKLTKNKHTTKNAQEQHKQVPNGMMINDINSSPGANEKEVSLNALRMEYLPNENIRTVPSATLLQQCDSNLVGVSETVSSNKNIKRLLVPQKMFDNLTNFKHTDAIEPDIQTLSNNKMIEMVDINRIMQNSFVGYDDKDNLQTRNIEMPSCSVQLNPAVSRDIHEKTKNVHNNKPTLGEEDAHKYKTTFATSLNTKTNIQTVSKDPLKIVDFNNISRNTPKNEEHKLEFVDASKLPCLELKNTNTPKRDPPSKIVNNTIIDANMLSSLQSCNFTNASQQKKNAFQIQFHNVRSNTETLTNSKSSPQTVTSNVMNNSHIGLNKVIQNSNTLPNNCFLVLNQDNLYNLGIQQNAAKTGNNLQGLHSKNLQSTLSAENKTLSDQQVTHQTNLNNEQNTVTVFTNRSTNSAPAFSLKNLYLINVPNQTQLFTNTTLNSTSNQSSGIECRHPLNAAVTDKPGRFMYTQPVFVQINSNTDTNMTEMNVSDTENCSTPSKKRRIPSPIPYRCLELKKGGFKMDSYGLTYFDRLGFFKAEKNRSRRCANILQAHIRIREQVLASLNKHSKFTEARASPGQNNLDAIIEACAKGVLDNSETDSLAETLSSDSNNAKKKNSVRQIKQLKRSRKHVDGVVRKICKSSEYNNKYSKYKLRELRVVLSRIEVEQYFKQKKLKHKRPRRKRNYATSKVKVPLLYNQNISLTETSIVNNNLSTTLVDENNFETIEQLYNNGNFEGKNIYFINSHKIITAMYMDIFSSFKNCVRSNQVKIINKRVANKLTGKRLKKLNRSKDVNKNSDKHLAFCNFIAGFHMLEKRREDDSNIISSEHCYSVGNSITG